MATPFRIKRSAIPGKKPVVADLQLGELALNTYDGYLFSQRDTGGVGIGTTVSLLTPWIENYGGQSIYYNQSVGIGTTNATSKLTVVGDVYISGISTLGITSATNLTSQSLVVSGISTLGITSTTNLTSQSLVVSGISTFTNGPILVGTATSTGTASQRLQVTGGAYVSGNLGVGVTNPAANTQVAIAGTLSISEVGGAGTRTLFTSSTSGFTLNHNDNSQITFQTLGVNRLTYSHSSNFWNIPSGTPFLVGTATSTGTASQLLQVDGGAYVSGSVGIGTTNPGATLNVVPTATSIAGLFSGTTSSDMVRITQLGTGNALVVEDSANPDSSPFVVRGDGSVGIGTINPTVALQLSPNASISNVGSGITLAGTVGSALTVAQFLHSNTNTSYLRIKATRNATGSDWTTASTKLLTVTDVTEQAYIEYNPNGSQYGMAFGSGATEWARFLQSGNLGIGTTNPTSKLHVVGDVRVTGVVTATTFVGALTGTATSTTNIPNLTGAITSNNTTTSLGSFSSANLATALTDETGSGAAVFATSPTLVTPVLGAATATSIVVSSGSTFTNGPILVGTATSTGTASQRLQVTGGAYVSGSVGIGTASPSFTADIAGDARVTSTNKMRFGGTAGTTNFYIQYNSTANSLDFVAG